MFKLSKFSLLKEIISLIFLPRCTGCQKIGSFLCQDCLENLPRATERRDENIISVFSYENLIIKKSIWLLKYRGIIELAKIFADALYETMITELGDELIWLRPVTNKKIIDDSSKVIVVPVPLSIRRLRRRGFNQAEEIAKGFVTHDPENFLLKNDLVFKIKETPTQVSIHRRAERIKNLRGAFILKNKKAVRNKIVIVIDDVSTTGTTIKEIAKILKQAGTRQVYGLVVAHG